MKYRQLTLEDRCAISALRKQGYSPAEIARAVGRHRSTIIRETRRNSRDDGAYRPEHANDLTRWRRSWSRRNAQFNDADWDLVCSRLQLLWSPDQISGRFRLERSLRISHESIYRYIWDDMRHGGILFKFLRGAQKKKWKRYRSKDSRGRLAGKRMIEQRPPGAENRSRFGGGHHDRDLRQALHPDARLQKERPRHDRQAQRPYHG